MPGYEYAFENAKVAVDMDWIQNLQLKKTKMTLGEINTRARNLRLQMCKLFATGSRTFAPKKNNLGANLLLQLLPIFIINTLSAPC